jgi:hypothetical protein
VIVDAIRDAWVRVAQPGGDHGNGNTLGQEVGCVRMPQRMQACIPDAGFPQASHDHLGNQIGTEVVSVALAKDHIQVLVITCEKTPVLCLLLAEELKGRYRTLREFKMPRFFALRGFDPQAGHRLFERSANV